MQSMNDNYLLYLHIINILAWNIEAYQGKSGQNTSGMKQKIINTNIATNKTSHFMFNNNNFSSFIIVYNPLFIIGIDNFKMKMQFANAYLLCEIVAYKNMTPLESTCFKYKDGMQLGRMEVPPYCHLLAQQPEVISGMPAP